MSTNNMNISGGSFTGGNFSVGNRNRLTSTTTSTTTTQADLLAELRAAHDQLVGAGSTAGDRQEIAEELGRIRAALESGQAKPAPVRNRWAIVQGIIGATATAGTAIAETTGKISDMITAVFGAS